MEIEHFRVSRRKADRKHGSKREDTQFHGGVKAIFETAGQFDIATIVRGANIVEVKQSVKRNR